MYLFRFKRREQQMYFEIFGETLKSAEGKLEVALDGLCEAEEFILLDMTENHSCPKCNPSCLATECKYP